MEYLIRQARITDIDRLASIGRATMPGMGGGSLDAADLLRQLVYLPNASLLVAEARREIVGGALLVLRPSVAAGGYMGTIDFLVVAPDHDADRVTEALVEDLLRSASNKGCSAVANAFVWVRRSWNPQPRRGRGGVAEGGRVVLRLDPGGRHEQARGARGPVGSVLT